MKEDFVDLYTLQKDVKENLEDLFPDKIWVKAEIASVSVKSGGHCYLDLVQSEKGKVVAKANAVIWSSYYHLLNAKFRSVAEKDISAGIEVLLRVMVNFHEVYGLSLIIDDIDASFILGEQQLKRAQTIAKLTQEGLMERQKTLELRDLPYYLALVSAETAAGLGDFRNHLIENEYSFVYQLDLYPAIMQGERAPESMIGALEEIANSGIPYDAVLILRGGGSEIDLLCFDDYELAAAIARFPIPVVTAIGHDKDYHVADMVAYDYVKTPTALADLFIDLTAASDEKISVLENRLALAFQNKVNALESKLDLLESGIKADVKAMIAATESNLAMIETKIAASDPRNVLKRGFSLVLDSKGKKLTSAKDSKVGDKISVLLADGRIGATVDEVV